MRKNTKSIFRILLAPLIMVLLFQAIISVIITLKGGTTKLLNQYQVNIQNQTVTNRKLILENKMIQEWSNVSEEEEIIQTKLKSLLKENGITIEEFIQDKTWKDELLKGTIQDALYMMRKNSVTGVFLVFANENMDQEQNECRGIYLRDSDPHINSSDYSDVLLERGSAQLSQEEGLPLDSFWSTDFAFEKSGTREADNFFCLPFEEARKQPDAGYENLGYWSMPFYLEDNVEKGGYRTISYSIPLIYEEETVYGVLGVEISLAYLEEFMPFQELNQEGQGSYMLAEQQSDGDYICFYHTGPFLLQSEEKEKIQLEDTEYSEFFKIKEEVEETDFFMSAYELRLYNTNTPFSDRQWILGGMQRGRDLFGIGYTIIYHLILSTVIAILVGIIGVYLSMIHVTRPIRKLAVCIRESSVNDMKSFERTGIEEIDRLYEVIKRLTEIQKQSEYRIREEKERYQIALQSCSDLLFSYNIQDGSVDIFNFAVGEENEGQHITNLFEKLEGRYIRKEDMEQFKRVFQNLDNKVHFVFQGKIKSDAQDYEWMELSGKCIYDENGKETAIIGSIKNIHEKTMKKIMQQEAERLDKVTGLYKRETGEKIISDAFRSGEKGCLVLIDIENFRSINETFGLVFGDVILEEVGIIIRKLEADLKKEGKRVTALRIGGDEFLLWFYKAEKKEIKKRISFLKSQIQALYPGKNFILSAAYGVVCCDEERQKYKMCLEKAQKVLTRARRMESEKIAFYEDTDQAVEVKQRGIGEIESIHYGTEQNMISMILHFFDKNNDLRDIMPVLLVKLGRFYHASDIIVTLVDHDFYTSYLSYQWHDEPREKNKIHRFQRKVFWSCVEKMDETWKVFGEENPLTEQERAFLGVSSFDRGVSIALHDNGAYMGAMTFVIQKTRPMWNEEDKNDLQEIVKVIENNIKREKYDQASRAKSDFLSRMSHEIRTPMNAIIGMTEIAIREKDQIAKVEDCLKKIDQSSRYLLGLINDVLDMSKIESGKMKLEYKNFSMKALAEGVRIMVESQANKQKVRYDIQMDCGELWVKADMMRISQVLINLLGNSIKFTPEGGKILLEIRKEKEEKDRVLLYFSVQDTGIGIQEKDAARIFESFEQASNNTTNVYGGTGLGLAISSRLIHMMGGDIKLESEVNKGSNFYFQIWFDKGEEEREEEGQTRWNKETFSGMKLLLVEDNDLNIEIAKCLLEMNGFQIDVCCNGQVAVERFEKSEKGTWEAILMDIRMPVMDGLEATKIIRQMNHPDAKTIPIIAMTANAFDEDMKKSIESGMNGHLVKPIDMDILLKMLASIVRK